MSNYEWIKYRLYEHNIIMIENIKLESIYFKPWEYITIILITVRVLSAVFTFQKYVNILNTVGLL